MRPAPAATLALVALLLAVVAAGSVVAAGGAGGPVQEDSEGAAACAADSPADFGAPASGDAIGYVEGYWYDEPIRIPIEEPADDDSGAGTDGDDAAQQPANASESDPADDSADDGAGDGAEADGGAGTGEEDPDAEDGQSDAGSSGADRSDDQSEDGQVETRPLDTEDGLDAAEREAVVARTAARVEVLRCRNFESVPDVAVRTQEYVRNERERVLETRSRSAENFDQARLEAALLIGNDVDATEARIDAISASTLGYYDPGPDRIVLVSDDQGEVGVDEPTLAHELVHALQDQHFDLQAFDANRTDPALAESGLIEGDASLVEHHYETRCGDGAWSSECLDATPDAAGDSGHVGLELLFFQPYNDGPRYAQRIYQAEGWSGLDERYADAPNSSRQTIFIDTPSAFDPERVEIESPPDPNWVRLRPPDLPDHDRMGPGTIAAAALAPTFDTEVEELYGAQFVRNNVGEERLDPLRPYNYRVDAASGWRGGRLQVYRSPAGEIGTVWRTTWNRPSDARTFHERYLELLSVYDARANEDYVGTATFEDSSRFDGRVAVLQNGSTVTVVHGPSLGALRSLSDGAARPAPEGYSSSLQQTEESKSEEPAPLPGPGPLTTAVALLVAGGILALRTRGPGG